MFKRAAIITMSMAILMTTLPLTAMAKDGATAGNDTSKSGQAATAETPSTKMTPPAHTPQAIANTIAVCGCGKVFTTDAKTAYLGFEGKTYACCSEECHKMATENPKRAAESAQANTVKLLGEVKTNQAKSSSASKQS